MRYPIAIEPGDDKHAWGVVVPDLPGCFSAGDTLDEAITNATEAMTLWIESVLDAGGDIPKPGDIAVHRANPEFDGWIWALAEVDPALLEDQVERVNITLPRRVLLRLDAKAKAAGESRSGFIAHLALMA
ncbi:MAG: type II toxin-antitoxin system HicB family antitoxin [Hydrogenophilales bacterium]|nr:type II toxin-antitoxin system HicB family antitoxin [Hydrogenophilales bacterium]